MTHQDAEEFGHAPNEPHDPQGRPVKSSKPIESKDCELDAKTKKALYRDDFDSRDGWKNVCTMLNYLEGNIIKYITRYKDKGGVLDLRKAEWYLTRLIKQEEKNNDDTRTN